MNINFKNISYWYIPAFNEISDQLCIDLSTENLSVYVADLSESIPSSDIGNLSTEFNNFISTHDMIWHGKIALFSALYLSCNYPCIGISDYIQTWYSPEKEQIFYIDKNYWKATSLVRVNQRINFQIHKWYHTLFALCNDFPIAYNNNAARYNYNIFLMDSELHTKLILDKNKIQLQRDYITNGIISSTSAIPIPGVYEYDDVVTLTAIPNEGYAFYRWKKYDSSSNVCTVDLSNNSNYNYNAINTETISASFIRKPSMTNGTVFGFDSMSNVKLGITANRHVEDIIVNVD